MEIKEEGTSEEGQHFLPTPQANESGDFQLTGKCVCTPPWNPLTMHTGSSKHIETGVLANGIRLTKLFSFALLLLGL